MKKVFFFVVFLGCFTVAFAQQAAPLVFKPIGIAEFSKHPPASYLTTPARSPMGDNGVITIKTKVKMFVFKPSSTTQLYLYIGDFINEPIAVVRCMEEKKDRYYLIDKNTGVIDTLFSLPIFFDQKKFASIGGTDLAGGKQLLQIGEFSGGHFKVTKTYKPTPAVYMSYLFWINGNTVFVSDHNTKYYKAVLSK